MGNHNIITAWTEIISFSLENRIKWYGGNYRGDRIGIYCFNDKSESGYVDIDYLHYR